MKKSRILATALFMVAGFSNSALSVEQEQIVIEDLSLSELNDEIEIVQKEIRRVFNAMNGDDEFDIICHSFTPTGSNIPQDACEPQFVITRRAENASRWRFGNEVLLSPSELRALLETEFEELADKMNAVAAESEYFRELNQVLGMLNERLTEISN